MTLRHQRSPYRYHVDRFVTAALPQQPHLNGLDVGGPSPQPRPAWQGWESINPLPGATHVGHAEDLGTFDDGEFDVVQATDMLYLVEDVPKALHEMWRVLKPGGVFVATVPCLWPPAGSADWGRWPAARWQAAVSVAGFEDVAVTPLGGWWTALEQQLHAAMDWWPPVLCRLDRRMTYPVAYGIRAVR